MTTCADDCWLVVWTPLKNISQLGLFFPTYGKIIQMFQATNQIAIVVAMNNPHCTPQCWGWWVLWTLPCPWWPVAHSQQHGLFFSNGRLPVLIITYPRCIISMSVRNLLTSSIRVGRNELGLPKWPLKQCLYQLIPQWIISMGPASLHPIELVDNSVGCGLGGNASVYSICIFIMYVTYVCMYLCIYLSICLSIYVPMYLCIYVSMYLCIYVCMYLCIYVCMYLCS